MLVGVVVIAHEPLASALSAAARHVYSCAPGRATDQVAVFDVAADADVAAAVLHARELLREVDRGAGVLVMTDALGATPGNIASQVAEAGRVAVIAGVNLPMLLRALCYREGKLADTVDKALAGGTRGVMQVGGTPVQDQSQKPSGHDYARLQDQQ